MKRTHRHRILPIILSAPLALAVIAPAQAGFWENLFGVQEKSAEAPPPPPTAQAPVKHASPKTSMRDEAERQQRRIAANLALKAAQAGKDPAVLALQDNTLRRGDIVSGPNGLMVYMGGDPDTGEARFLPANDPNLERRMRETLQGFKRPAATPAVASARPAPNTAAQPATNEKVAIARDGKTIRVVGAYPVLQ